MAIHRYAHIENNIVINVSLFDDTSDFIFDSEVIKLNDEDKIGIGWSMVNGQWVKPEVIEEGPVDALGDNTDVQYPS